MKIVVLDGFTLNPGDLSWDGLHALGACEVYDHSTSREALARAANADLLLTNKCVISGAMMGELPKLKYIGVSATGFNVVDVEAAAEHGIPVANVRTYGTDSVAQMVFAHILNLTQRVAHHAETTREGRWGKSRDFCYWDTPLRELAGLTLGLVGFGRIARATARIGRAFGMTVVVHTRTPSAEATDVVFCELNELFARSDVVSLHCPLTPQTEGMVNAERLASMKPTAFLVNTSRGPLIDEPALLEALKGGRIAGAGLDVLATEPPVDGNSLQNAPNCFVTPHIAWATRAARSRLLDSVVENMKAFLSGSPTNIVN
jgi:glycerate dehydrogenase